MKDIKVEYQWIFYDDVRYHLQIVPGYLFHFLCNQEGISDENFDVNLPVLSSRFSLFSSVCTEISIVKQTTIGDLVDAYLTIIELNKTAFYNMNIHPSIITQDACYEIDDYSIKVTDLLEDFDCGEIIRIAFFISILQGEVYRSNGVIYFMHSNERTTHNKPHVHVRKPGSFDVSIDLLNLSLLDGKITERDLRDVRKQIKRKQTILIDYWNNNTNGITINEDYTLKYC